MNLRLILTVWVATLVASAGAFAQQPNSGNAGTSTGEAQWIWSPDYAQGESPAGSFYFRKSFNLPSPDVGKITITCQDRYELFVNGRRVGGGSDWQKLENYDISNLLLAGRNTIAVLAQKTEPGMAGLVARVVVRPRGGTWLSFSTNSSWRVNEQRASSWFLRTFDDSSWSRAQSFGEYGQTAPWSGEYHAQTASHDNSESAPSAARFTVPHGFRVQRFAQVRQTGSVLSMAFDERGNLLISREGSGIFRLVDSDNDTYCDTVEAVCDSIKNCHGILSVNGDIYAVGHSDSGAGLHYLHDEDGDGKMETVTLMVKFDGGMNEHGPHVPLLGPDGFLYLVMGNHAKPAVTMQATSPYHHYYEGDLVQPRYEDAGGHAVGVKAPGGMVLRINLQGTQVEAFAGGLRNAYDAVFTPSGDLFTYDSDMEWDEGLPWYRPTRLMHVTAGAEFGWRSGWAKWPEYYIDSLPSQLSLGRGSPTGLEVYDHHQYPEQYHGAMFLGDWTMGRILMVRLARDGSSYRATQEPFVEGEPLNVTDLAVGPDGSLYFSTGGRNTEGGIYRVVYDGEHKPVQPHLTGIHQAVRQPQFYSAFARERVALVQQQMGDSWGSELARVAVDNQLPAEQRTRAMDFMHLYGPYPSEQLLLQLAGDALPAVRAKAATLLGLHPTTNGSKLLSSLLGDPNPLVRRCACEAVTRAGLAPSAQSLVELLADTDVHVAWAAGRALQQLPISQWQDLVLMDERAAVYARGSVALLAMVEDPAVSEQVIDRGRTLLRGFISDGDFVGMLRVMEVAIHRATPSEDYLETLRNDLTREYPVRTDANPPWGAFINRELVRLLSALDATDARPRMLNFLNTNEPLPERMHVAAHLSFMKSAWTLNDRLILLEFFERHRAAEGGFSLARYVDNFSRDVVKGMSYEEQLQVLYQADRWPTAGLGVLTDLPPDPGQEVIERLLEIDASLDGRDDEAAARMQTGVVAVLARRGDPDSMAYLREVFDRDPDRRVTIAMGLAQQADDDHNWPLLIRSLAILDGGAAVEVLQKLSETRRTTNDAEHIRQVILCGLRMTPSQSVHAVALLELWTGIAQGEPEQTVPEKLRLWQNWYAQTFPARTPATLPKASPENKWSFDELLFAIQNAKPEEANPAAGELVFRKALCIRCHRMGSDGQGVGPDLTMVSRRFHRKEMLESLLFPSQVISDQYASHTVVTTDGRQFTGLVGALGDDAIVVTRNDAERIRIPKDRVEEMLPSHVSSMPEGLLNPLSMQEILDLFAYLNESPDQRVVRKSR